MNNLKILFLQNEGSLTAAAEKVFSVIPGYAVVEYLVRSAMTANSWMAICLVIVKLLSIITRKFHEHRRP